MSHVCMISTNDNPFNPFTQWDQWYAYDNQLGHNTMSYLGRITRSSDELSEADQDQAIEDAIDEIIAFNPQGPYIKVLPDSEPAKV